MSVDFSITGYEGRLAQMLTVERNNDVSINTSKKFHFYKALDRWKERSVWNRGKGLPEPERPAVPMLEEINEAKATAEFKRWWFMDYTPEVNYDRNAMIDLKPLEVSDDEWLTDDKPLPAPSDPVSIVSKRYGCWQVEPGDTHAIGDTYQHPRIGAITKISQNTPFSRLVFWEAQTPAGVAVWAQDALKAF